MRGIVFAVVALLAPVAVQAQQEGDYRALQRRVTDIAFDPDSFFGPDGRLYRVATIRYLGDDWGFPVHAIAISNSCVVSREPGCRERRIARMVRGTMTSPPERPRRRGSALIGRLNKLGPLDGPALARALDANLDWLEADLDACPNARAALSQARDAAWIAPGLLSSSPGDDLEIVLHADTIRVEFAGYLRSAVYDGYIARDTPAAWADAFAKTIEPCWRPSAAARPWHVSPDAKPAGAGG